MQTEDMLVYFFYCSYIDFLVLIEQEYGDRSRLYSTFAITMTSSNPPHYKRGHRSLLKCCFMIMHTYKSDDTVVPNPYSISARATRSKNVFQLF